MNLSFQKQPPLGFLKNGAYRKQDLARKLMDFAKKETAEAGFDKLYLITDHTEFYEKCGWTFYGIIKEDDGADIRMYETKTGF